MLKWQAVGLERWLLVEDPVLQNNLMTSITAYFVKDCMQEIPYGDMLEIARRSLLKESLKLGRKRIQLTRLS
ncbi:hypothetical protein N1851_019440 [Merluccius polli]|uniref:Uncharacterized protein n=1 Tax=Merluccius polli TaxID=89951 RepID=A0AA47MM77_MERPO|nr:hypothetical protein N1851_032645 [Merluccius polli]KAK0142630.1 hypothetical protein N1851_019440 [Merluccius polli]